MAPSESEVRDALHEVEDPLIGEDVVSLELVNAIRVEDDTARVSLAFNTPYSPAEMELGDRIREAIQELGLEPQLQADVGEEHGFDEKIMPEVRNVVAVASGKGGVGKTTVAANLAAGLEQLGARVGILDADVHGPNVPRILPVEGEPGVTPEEEELVPPVSDGVRVMSMRFLTENRDDPAILRGPMVNNVMTHFHSNVHWGTLDYLVVDLPPGTGDASLNLLQELPVMGTVIVTTPQEMAVDDARKGLRLFEKHDTPVLGIVENMSLFECPNCGDQHDPFGRGGAEEICEEYDVPLLPRLPIHEDFGGDAPDAADADAADADAADGDAPSGPVVKDEDSPVQETAQELVEAIVDRIGEVNRRKVRGDDDEATPDGPDQPPSDPLPRE